jgi:hypothetical protein
MNSNWKNEPQADEWAPAEHAAAAFCRSVAEQTDCFTGTGSVRNGWHPPYGVGQTICWLAQPRGVTPTSQVDGGASAVQFWQLPPN